MGSRWGTCGHLSGHVLQGTDRIGRPGIGAAGHGTAVAVAHGKERRRAGLQLLPCGAGTNRLTAILRQHALLGRVRLQGDQAAVSEDEVKGMIASTMRDFANALLAQAE